MPAKEPKPKPPPKPWRREDGRYRSSDDRFTIESGGAGRWFLTDDESLDELGLARTLGPYPTLDDARAAADLQREEGSGASPLAARIEAAKSQPRKAGSREKPGSRSAARAEDAGTHAQEQGVEPAQGPGVERAPAPVEPPRTWLDELEASDRPAAVRARRLVAQLEQIGVPDSDGIVRRDVLGRQPAVAAALLGRTIAEALRAALDPATLAAEAGRSGREVSRSLAAVDEATLAAYAAVVARHVLEATLDVVTAQDHADGAGRDLPGWRLVERPATRDAAATPRRLLVSPDDIRGRRISE